MFEQANLYLQGPVPLDHNSSQSFLGGPGSKQRETLPAHGGNVMMQRIIFSL